MRHLSISLAIIGLLVLLTASTDAQAQATRTWVSGVGDDANPCSRTAPCKTFAGAISKTAAGGVINVLDPGGFGAVTITKGITIDGGGREAGGILAAGSNGIIINAGPTDMVVIRNLSIDGVRTGLTGIRFLAGGNLHLDNVLITDFVNRGIEFLPSGASQLYISNTEVRRTGPSAVSGGGLYISPSGGGIATVSISGSRFTDSGFGIRVNPRSIVAVRDSVLSGNVDYGLLAVDAGQFANVTLENCQVANNGYGVNIGAGIYASGAAVDIRITDNLITNNELGLRLNGGLIRSFGDNVITDNGNNGTPSQTLSQK